MSQGTISRRYTWQIFPAYGPFLLVAVGVVGGAITSIFSSSDQVFLDALIAAFVMCAIVWFGFVWYYWRLSRIMEKRSEALLKNASSNGWQWHGIGDSSCLTGSSLYSVGSRDMTFKNYVVGQDWQYIEYSYGVYHESKNNEYKIADMFYGVMSMSLPRPLPHVLFDSKQMSGRQFAPIYDKNQLHILEGDFSDIFDTYFPSDYTIDGLSFITPDVMEALLNAREFDVEIAGDRLLLYGPLYIDGLAQVAIMSRKLAAIKKELLDNILTYRDERLPYAEGRAAVHPTGQYLKRRKKGIWAAISLSLLYVIIRILIEVLPPYN